MNGWMDERMDDYEDGWTDEYLDEWTMDGQIESCIYSG